LTDFFLTRFNARQKQSIKGFSDAALSMLQHYNFPGNVRELQNAVERAATFCEAAFIDVQHLPQRIRDSTQSAEQPNTVLTPVQLPQSPLNVDAMPSLETVQRQYIHQVLAATAGNKRHAADILGITRRTLYRWIE
ncbi:MAG: sigma-54-dependent Fis family transcriptional regulator, partial [Gammaproteobacteria bacterium]|nr:sigma-54-dependent Fis family transcriptional regulator [Gammaproteobacteria bacterium]